MPAGDSTGPLGWGPMTGRAAGYCAGFLVPGYMNAFVGRSVWSRPYTGPYGQAPFVRVPLPYAYGYGPAYGATWGWPFGWFGRGFGRGWGRGMGWGRGWAWWGPAYPSQPPTRDSETQMLRQEDIIRRIQF